MSELNCERSELSRWMDWQVDEFAYGKEKYLRYPQKLVVDVVEIGNGLRKLTKLSQRKAYCLILGSLITGMSTEEIDSVKQSLSSNLENSFKADGWKEKAQFTIDYLAVIVRVRRISGLPKRDDVDMLG